MCKQNVLLKGCCMLPRTYANFHFKISITIMGFAQILITKQTKLVYLFFFYCRLDQVTVKLMETNIKLMMKVLRRAASLIMTQLMITLSMIPVKVILLKMISLEILLPLLVQ